MINHKSASRSLLLSLSILAMSCLMPRLALGEVLTIRSVKQTDLHTLIEEPANAGKKIKANLILLVGGNGVLKLNKKGTFKQKQNNFLTRTRKMFQARGYLTALVGAPLAKQNKKGLRGFRTKAGHAKDLAKIARQLKARNKLPVIIIGTSRGTISAANAASRDRSNFIDGVILSSTLLVGSKNKSINGVAGTKISVPVLIAHHQKDGCKKTPYGRARKLVRKLQAAGIATALQSFTGGHTRSKPCKGLSYHGFLGIEKKVIEAMIAWMEQQVLSN